eukprot:jgi/Chlat1/6122/Chrsp409S05665
MRHHTHRDDSTLAQINDFFTPNGVQKLVFFHQVPEVETPEGEFVQKGKRPTLYLTTGEMDKLRGKAAYFVRVNPKGVTAATIEQDVATDWARAPEDAVSDFLSSAHRFASSLAEAAGSLHGGVELRKPDRRWLDTIEMKAAGFNRAAADNECMEHVENVLEEWCGQVERLLEDGSSEQGGGDKTSVIQQGGSRSSTKDSEDVGPHTELEFWRNRMAKFNSITEQLKSKEAKLVLGVAMAGRSKAHRTWKAIDIKVTDAANEAKDNVKYLTTLEMSLEPMYTGTPQAVIDSLPALMNNIKMMHTIARYYNTPERMTTLFCKVTNQMIANCKAYIVNRGAPIGSTPNNNNNTANNNNNNNGGSTSSSIKPASLWEQQDNLPTLLKNLEMAVKLNEAYQEQYRLTRDRLLAQPKGKQFDFNEQKIFGKFDLFCKRVAKLTDMFTTVHQFTTLAQHTHHIEGLQDLISSFFAIIQDFQRKPYDLLDYMKNQFDRDFLEFNVNIHDLETALQGFINASFENITSTSHALALLRQFQSILQRESLRADLDDKYMVIFRNYGLDLDAVQRIYEKYKHSPPLVRNAPPVAGNIMWARQLLRRIEEPMKKFATNKSIMATKESKRIVKTYNLRHPESGVLLVNFDRDILQLMRETKYLQRLGIEVPESAKMVLLQEDKFKHYYNQLSYALKEYDRVVGCILPVVKPLLGPHLDDLDKKIQPGMYILTWTSMNIDGYLHRIHNGLARLEELIRKINDIVDNRIEANLKAISKTLLGRFIKRVTESLQVRNAEVERAVVDLVALVATYPRQNNDTPISETEVARLRKHYSKLMYQAILAATKSSFNAMKKRLGSRVSGGFLFMERPFFDVDVELTIPNVSMSPSLEDIQGAINTTAKKVLRCSSELAAWGIDGINTTSGPRGTFYDLIAADKEIVKSVLLLTGSIEGAKNQVSTYISTFSKYDFLWKRDLQAEYAQFMSTNPSIEAFEAELRKYMDLEQEIAQIPPVHNIGALSLETQPMKYSLKAEAASWKAQFAKNLHKQGLEDLKKLNMYMRETGMKLGRQIEDLEDVRAVMALLKEVREMEAEIDTRMTPIEEMYALLLRNSSSLPTTWLTTSLVGFKRELIKEVKLFVVDAASFRADFENNGPMVPGLAPMEAVERLKKFQTQFELRKRKWDNYTSGEELFGLAITRYPELEKTEKELQLLDRLYSLYVNVITTINGYADILWVDVVANIDSMTEQVNAFQASCKKLPKALRDWQAYSVCKKTIDEFLEVLPLLQQLSSKAMRNRHWLQLMHVTSKQLNLAEDVLKLGHLLELDLLPNREQIEELTNAAVKEEQVETKLQAIADEWADMSLTFNTYKGRGPVVLKGAETAEIVERLEDSQMALGSMATNRFSAPFRDDVNGWIVRLSTVGEIIEMWLQVQNMWMYMEAVFSGGDIAKQLPAEAKRFQNIDKNYMKIVTSAFEVRNVVQTCYGNELMKNLLPHLIEQLELCQKSLSAYLETKRADFPRFYFVSDPTLLEILSLGSDPQAVQPHFQSGLFDAVSAVTFDKTDKTKMTEMHSVQGEKVAFESPVQAQGNIEDWLKKMVDQMQTTVKSVIKRAHGEVNAIPVEDFLFKYPAQVALLGIQFQWTADAQLALAGAKTDKGIMAKTMKKVDGLLRSLVALTTRELSRNDRTNVETVVTVHVHQRDTFEELVKKKVREPTDFEWLKQCRFYWREERSTVIISIADVDFEYSYEYLGVKERLVITPLTDRCYVTLSQALGMYLGGAPAGPAGTGKTETTKDLGSTLGKFVVVFNCSDQMDYKGMGKIYKGLAQSGLWGCFDEFNRINLDVLSVCAQQLFCILSAIRDRRTSFVFTDGTTTAMDPRVGFFITMNPGYAGRQELPENLKSLFRGVTMMVPNRQIIMKVKLAACGYQENELLAKKFNVLYALCEQQLSKQPHYDFGLRNILSVLRAAGGQKRKNPDRSETFLIMRTLRDMNLSKFVAEDVPLFLSLIDDLFPSIKADKATFPDVEAALLKQVKDRGLQAHPSWLGKCVQLYETYQVRHGIMLVGPAGSGKTAIIECLASALGDAGQGKHVVWRMNPKALTAPQMFGKLDSVTGDWTDGVFAVLWRKAAKSRNQNTWIVLDGPVDAIWIENLNTVLDDNKVLTLANGDRIPMISAMKAIFEPENLSNASPATVSRAGIIYVSESELGWKPVAQSWLETRRPAEAALLRPCFDKFVASALDFTKMNCKNIMLTEDVSTLLTLLTACLETVVKGGELLGDGHYERVFLFCVAWSIGALLPGEDRSRFDSHLRGLAPDNMPELDADNNSETMYEYVVNDETTAWQHWKERVPEWEYPRAQERPKFASMLIPTLDSVRYEFLLTLASLSNKGALLVGGPGTAKTATVMQFLAKVNPDEVSTKTITFSSLTTPRIFQSGIEAAMEKRQGRTFGPPGGKRMNVFIDDISMPAINEWGDQVTNEIVRQLLDQGGFYNLDKPGEFKNIVDVRYLSAMNAPGGGKNDVPNRLKRQFAIWSVPLPSNAAIHNVFGALMEGRFEREKFGEGLVNVAQKLVPTTITLWNKVAAKMLPTPAKFHYLFNMRDLSRVFQGVILAEPDRFNNKAPTSSVGVPNTPVTSPEGYLLALWRHECERVFADKLTTPEDKLWVTNTIMSLCKEAYGAELAGQIAGDESVHFVDFLREPVVDAEGVVIDERPSHYEAVGSVSDLKTRVEALQVKYNERPSGGNTSSRLELVLFHDALTHIMRISRILAMERGSALLVGVGGSGKQSLTRLAAYIAGAYVFQIAITKTYGVTNLLEDIKGLYKVAGFKGQPVAFIFTDADVKEESFLEYINQMLMTGEVAGLFPKDEIDMIVNDMRPVMKQVAPNEVDTYENLYKFFLNRVRDNLHVVLCFSPVGDRFSRRAMQFPGLINGCTIDWFLPWPRDALHAVAQKLLDDFPMQVANSEVKEELINHMSHVHEAVTAATKEYYEKYRRHVYVTPKSYLSFIGGYKVLYAKKYAETKELADKINSGLAKLFQAKADVNRMTVDLDAKNKELAAAQKVTESLLKEISASTAVAEKEKAKVAVVTASAKSMASRIGAAKEEAERDLAAAKPALDEAVAALSSITAKDIGTLKQLKNPPDIVKRIFDTCLILKMWPLNRVAYEDVKGVMTIQASYSTALQMMSEISFLGSLVHFPKESINDETVELLLPYFSAPDFTYESAKKASGNVAGLCSWCKAMCTYHEVAKVVEPKIIKLHESEAELKAANRQLAEAEEKMAVVQARLDKMQAEFDGAMKEKQRLEDDAEKTQRRMDVANALIHALSGEETRWTAQSKEFETTIDRLPADCAAASAFASYLGPFNREARDTLLAKDFLPASSQGGQSLLPATPKLDVVRFLVEDAEVGEWTLQGLPMDDLSIQNGIIVTRSQRWPLLVDPQGQGLAWIKAREEANNLKITSFNDKQFRSHLEDCLAYGKPLLIENVEEDVDPILDPVLEKRIMRAGSRGFKIVLADGKEVDYTDTFRLFLTTRLPNPHYTPELSAKVAVIDFRVTAVGLEDQLLNKLILKEKHELEEQRQKLLEDVNTYKKKIKQLEDDLLYRLSTSTGNLLDDTELIDVLAVTKQTAQDVNEKLNNANDTKRKITEACEEYKPVAHRATLIYSLIAEFSSVNVMYQTSLRQFNALYEAAIDRSDKAAMPSKRINNIIEYMTFLMYQYVQRGLFERHKITFTLMLAMRILVSAKVISDREVSLFLRGAASIPVASDGGMAVVPRKKPKEWIPDAVWTGVLGLSAHINAFHDLPESVARSDGLWRQWYDQEAPETAKVPDLESNLGGGGNTKNAKWERLLLVRTMREDRTLITATDFISDALGARYVESIPLNMEATWAESSPKTPLICLLSAGADPTKLIEDLAKRKKVKVLGVSMGQGQEVIARKYMATATQEGNWVLLQNTHLGLGYLAEVEQFLLKAEDVHEQFRLWITAEPHPKFPIGLLQMSIKVTNEAPVGIRAGLKSSYAWVSQDMLDGVPRPEWRQLLFVACFCHSVVQERRKFGPIGWNVPYEFNHSDLAASVQFLQNHLNEMDAKRSNVITWTAVRYMVAEIQYGGRITDDYDRLLMNTYAEQYLHAGVTERGPNVAGYELHAGYTVPPGNADIVHIRAHIDALPGQESPELFGLHSNADLTFRTLQVQQTLNTIIDTQPKNASSSTGLSREETVDRIAEDLLSKVPPPFKVEDTKEKLKKLPGSLNAPLNVHLKQETDRLNTIINMCTQSLKNLRLAVAGTIALSGTLIDALDALFDGRIPKAWLAKSWDASALGVWFNGLLQRYDQLNRWLNTGRPKAFWLTGFFNPQGFLTAMKQEVARKHAAEKWALDDVVMASEVTFPAKEVENLREGPNEGVYVYGLYLDGCAWNAKENRLVDPEPKKLYCALPLLYVTGVLATNKRTDQQYSCPTYRVKARTGQHFVANFDLRSEDPPSKWILRGVSLLCTVD